MGSVPIFYGNTSAINSSGTFEPPTGNATYCLPHVRHWRAARVRRKRDLGDELAARLVVRVELRLDVDQLGLEPTERAARNLRAVLHDEQQRLRHEHEAAMRPAEAVFDAEVLDRAMVAVAGADRRAPAVLARREVDRRD